MAETRASPPVRPLAPTGGAVDDLGRPWSDLRISVTDRCNFRCPYCMPEHLFPKDGHAVPHEDVLTYEEITRIARVGTQLGLRKIRLTGGEPLLRHKLESLVSSLAALPEIREVTLTTNGVLLPQHAPRLAAAGLRRVNVSLDALNPEVFHRMTGGYGTVDQVLHGIAAARSAGLGVKVNCVVRRAWNDAEIVPLAKKARDQGWTLRFIEFMDVGMSNAWHRNEVVPMEEIIALIHAHHPLGPMNPDARQETAVHFPYLDDGGEIGVIASVSRPFCRSCGRARLTARGQLHTCLFNAHGHDMLRILRSGASDDQLTWALRGIWNARDDRYSELRPPTGQQGTRPEMSQLGG